MQPARLDYMLDDEPLVSPKEALAAWRAGVERDVAAMRVPGIERLAGAQWWSHITREMGIFDERRMC